MSALATSSGSCGEGLPSSSLGFVLVGEEGKYLSFVLFALVDFSGKPKVPTGQAGGIEKRKTASGRDAGRERPRTLSMTLGQ